MHFDHLDESYAMVKSNLHFDEVTLTGLTGLCIPVRPISTTMPILIINICPPIFFDKVCMRKNNLWDQNCLRMMTNKSSAIYLF